jgi:hypothetical protein
MSRTDIYSNVSASAGVFNYFCQESQGVLMAHKTTAIMDGIPVANLVNIKRESGINTYFSLQAIASKNV